MNSVKITCPPANGVAITFETAPETTAFAADVATDFTADPASEDAAPATAGIAALAALALADAKILAKTIAVVYEGVCVSLRV